MAKLNCLYPQQSGEDQKQAQKIPMHIAAAGAPESEIKWYTSAKHVP